MNYISIKIKRQAQPSGGQREVNLVCGMSWACSPRSWDPKGCRKWKQHPHPSIRRQKAPVLVFSSEWGDGGSDCYHSNPCDHQPNCHKGTLTINSLMIVRLCSLEKHVFTTAADSIIPSNLSLRPVPCVLYTQLPIASPWLTLLSGAHHLAASRSQILHWILAMLLAHKTWHSSNSVLGHALHFCRPLAIPTGVLMPVSQQWAVPSMARDSSERGNEKAELFLSQFFPVQTHANPSVAGEGHFSCFYPYWEGKIRAQDKREASTTREDPQGWGWGGQGT